MASRRSIWLKVAISAVASTLAGTTTVGLAAARGAVRHPTSSRQVTSGRRERPTPLTAPRRLQPFRLALGATGAWQPVGRTVHGRAAIFETHLLPPGGYLAAGIAWMDTKLLRARLYSGSMSPGGGPYRFTAPIGASAATSLVAAFNGGFQMNAAQGGYFTEGRTVVPLRVGAASLVIYKNGTATVGTWGSPGIAMGPNVEAVRQNLVLLVNAGRPTPLASTGNWLDWGATCGLYSCSGPGVESQWRSALGVTSDGALVYVAGPALDPLQLAELCQRAGATRAMELDINPNWPDFSVYSPPPGGRASPANGSKLVASMAQGPATFFDPSWARDFVTMSTR